MVAKAKSSVEGQRVAVGYVRVSTEVQAREGQSLEAQEERLKQWAAVNGYAMLTVYRDEGLSGKRADNRPGLQAALSAVCANRGVLVTYSLSRLARSTRDAILIAERLEKAGAELASLSEKIDTTSASGRAFFKIMAVMAELEREQTSERTKLVLSHRKAKGLRSAGALPYGYDLGADGETLVPNTHEQEGLKRLRQLRAEGLSLRAVGAALSAEGFRPKAGGQWQAKVVRGLAARA